MATIHVLVPIETDFIKRIGETADGHGYIELDKKVDLIVTDEPVANITWKEKSARKGKTADR